MKNTSASTAQARHMKLVAAGLFAAYFFLVNNLLSAQNLVPNQGFEERISTDFSGAKGYWQKCCNADSPDYFSFDDPSTINLFKKYLGGIKPYSGKAFVGIFCYRRTTNFKFREVREFIETPLIHPLQKGKRYRVEFHVALDAESNAGIDDLGMYFSDHLLHHMKTKDMYKLKPQVVNPAHSFLRNKDNWMTIKGEYLAKGNENCIIIGNFYPDNKTRIAKIIRFSNTELPKKSKWRKQKGEEIAYYYIDDVVVENINDTLNPNPVVADTVPLVDSLEDTLGMPSKQFTNLKQGDSLSLENVLFVFGKTEWVPSSEKELKQLYQYLKSNPRIRIQITGYTDNVGTEEYNMELSLSRAKAISTYLEERGISGNRLKCVGQGSTHPVSANATEKGREKNRRVEIKIIGTQ